MTDHQILYLVLASLFSAVNIVAFVFVLLKFRREKLRSQFRSIIAEHRVAKDENEDELKLAGAIFDSASGKPQALSAIHIDELVEDYILDIGFKPKTYRHLLHKINDDKNSWNSDDLNKTLVVLESWKSQYQPTEMRIMKTIREAAEKKESNASAVKTFIDSRDGYFKSKQQIFTEDIKDVVSKAFPLKSEGLIG
jgi:hypothetical protein